MDNPGLYIGNVKIENKAFLAPMAGVTDMAFRGICRSMGCGLTYTEMVSAKGLMFNNKNTETLLKVHKDEKIKAVQIFGSDEKILGEMAKRLNDYPVDIIDINMGCPANKIVRNGDGSALLKDIPLIGKIVYNVSRMSNKPVTVKMRKGFFDGEPVCVEAARVAEESGAAAVSIHGRYREQYYGGKADWDIIGEVKAAVKIPVIGNGDVTDVRTYLKMLEYTGCDAVMIGRAAQGNPWIFRDINEYLKTGKIPNPPSIDEKIDMAMFHTEQVIKDKGEHMGVLEMRKHLGWYVKGMEGAALKRVEINKAVTFEDVKALFK